MFDFYFPLLLRRPMTVPVPKWQKPLSGTIVRLAHCLLVLTRVVAGTYRPRQQPSADPEQTQSDRVSSCASIAAVTVDPNAFATGQVLRPPFTTFPRSSRLSSTLSSFATRSGQERAVRVGGGPISCTGSHNHR